jgi:nitrate reductase NapE component
MHHLKKWPTYNTEKKTKLITFLILKFVIFGLVFSGLMLLLKNYVSPVVLVGIAHLIIFAVVIAVVFAHTHRTSHIK